MFITICVKLLTIGKSDWHFLIQTPLFGILTFPTSFCTKKRNQRNEEEEEKKEEKEEEQEEKEGEQAERNDHFI